ncbi:J domain-containing protein [Candidatus Woesearchaeota archaeon]|nr:J domain-containing protein [Candidatus Woesearchaeota archaeon]
MKDYYKILGVERNAREDDIRSAFRNLSKRYHPDTHPNDPDAEAKFKEANEAYETLSDPSKRMIYDSLIPEDIGITTSNSSVSNFPKICGKRNHPNLTRVIGLGLAAATIALISYYGIKVDNTPEYISQPTPISIPLPTPVLLPEVLAESQKPENNRKAMDTSGRLTGYAESDLIKHSYFIAVDPPIKIDRSCLEKLVKDYESQTNIGVLPNMNDGILSGFSIYPKIVGAGTGSEKQDIQNLADKCAKEAF